MTQRNWTAIGAPYTGDADRERVERVIDALTWREPPCDVPALPGLAINKAIRELGIPKVSRIAYDGAITYPDGDSGGTAYYGLYGIEGNYANGRAQVYLLDTGGACTVLRSDFTPTATEVA